MKKIIKQALDDMRDSQINLSSDAARETVATLISTALKSEYSFTKHNKNLLTHIVTTGLVISNSDILHLLNGVFDNPSRNRLKKAGHSGSGWIFILTTHNCLSCCWKDLSLTASFSVVSQKSCGVLFPCSIIFLIEDSE